MTTVLLAGHLCVDLTPSLGDGAPTEPGRLFVVGPMAVRLGGSVANTGRVLAASGITCRVSAAIGDDALGAVADALLRDDGLSPTDVVRLPDAATSYSIVLEPAGTDRTFWHHAGANDAYLPGAIDLDGVDVVHVGYPPLLGALTRDRGAALRALFARARAAGATTSLDLAVVDPGSAAARVDWNAFFEAVLPLTDIVSPSLDDLRSAVPGDVGSADWAQRLVRAGAAIAMVSDGAKGLRLATGSAARLRSGGRPLALLGSEWAEVSAHRPAASVDRVVTTNGAGDAATAGLLAALLGSAPPDEALDRAAATAAAIVAGREPPHTRRTIATHPVTG